MTKLSKILFVEDELLITLWAEDVLADAGYEVISVTNADEAIAVLEIDASVSLVVTDVDMPGSMDGLKLAAAVRDRWPPVYLVIASGKRRPKVSDLPNGAVFLPKPYLAAEMLSAVKQASQSH